MTLQQLKDMNEKERVMYLATAKVKELKRLLKGTTMISKLKKKEALTMVIDLTCDDSSYEVMELEASPSTDSLQGNIQLVKIENMEEVVVLSKEEILDTAYESEKIDGFISALVGRSSTKSKIKVMEETIHKKRKDMEIGLKDIEDIEQSIKMIAQVNEHLSRIGSNIKMKYELIYNTKRKRMYIEMALVSGRMFREISGYGDYIYIPCLGYSSASEIDNAEELCTNMECLYILDCDGSLCDEINLFEQSSSYDIDTSQGILKTKSSLFYSSDLKKEREFSDTYTVKDESGNINFSVDIDVLLEVVMRKSDRSIFRVDYEQISELEQKFMDSTYLLDTGLSKLKDEAYQYYSCA